MMETRRLYYEDVYIKEFKAKVKECRKGEKFYEIDFGSERFLSRRGRSALRSLGTLGGAEVKDVQEKERRARTLYGNVF